MTWNGAFSLVNLLALLAWAGLILGPRGSSACSAVLHCAVGLLCLAYVLLLALVTGGLVDPVAQPGAAASSFTTIAGVRAIFASDAGMVIGWIHYLALDLLAGLWISREADTRGVSRWLQAPVLLLTFVAGPAGLLVWLALRRLFEEKVSG